MASQPIANPAASLLLSPLRNGFTAIRYLGGLPILATSALRAAILPRGDQPSLYCETTGQLDRLLGMALPIVALVHVAMGSFLSMQAYFGATFIDGIGPVVGVGLVRNLAPLQTGFILAGLYSARFVAELRGRDCPEGDPARLVASRVLAAAIAGPVLAAWGAAIGVLIGWVVAWTIMGVTVPAFFDMFFEMLWVRDIVGLALKGSLFAGLAALIACHEALRPTGEAGRETDAACLAACRAATLSIVVMLVINSGWFLLFYHGGPAFGPTVLTPPTE
jgi:phospholipid/cholesterol/gamma-HCH transport system permease protein